VFLENTRTSKVSDWAVVCAVPVERLASGKVKYKTVKASWDKRRAVELFRKKQDEFTAADRFGLRGGARHEL